MAKKGSAPADLRRILKEQKYRKLALPRLWNADMQGGVYAGVRHTVVVIEKVRLASDFSIGAPNPTPCGREVKRFFRQLQKVLKENGLANKQTSIALPGGGNLPIPDAFTNWAKRHGIQVSIVGEAVPRELEKRLSDNTLRGVTPKPFVGIVDNI